MALTPEEIEGREFSIVDRGYRREEVDRFLTEVAASYRYAIHNLLPGVAPQPGKTHATEAVGEELLAKLGDQVADILRSAEKLAESVRTEAETDVAAARARSDLEIAELRRAGEADREQAKRLLVRAQEQADVILTDAEHRADSRAREAEADARARADHLVDEARRRTENLLSAEKSSIERLRAARAELDASIDRLRTSEDRPVLDLTQQRPVMRVGPRSASNLASATAGEAPSGLDADQDPVARMVRAAVGRAVQHSISPALAPESDEDPDPAPDQNTPPST